MKDAPNQADAPSNGAGTQEVAVDALSNAAGSQAAGPSNAARAVDVPFNATENQADVPSNAAGTQEVGPSNPAGAVERFSGQLLLENGSSHYWDCDNDGGPKPCDLYGEYLWEIKNFSETKEAVSPKFKIGGHTWLMGIVRYSDHLVLKLTLIRPWYIAGWSHFVQVSGTLLNNDITKSRRLDAFHQFSEKVPFLGWKKFMPISNLSDGYIHDADTLKVKVQLQVISEREDRPFRCLDDQYGSELQRLHFTSVEKTYQKIVEERSTNLLELVKEQSRLSSFSAFWSAMAEESRLCMASVKIETILKVLVKQFFREKEVTSALIMDSIFNGLKLIESKKHWPTRIVRTEKGKFTLVHDFLAIIDKAAFQALPQFNEHPIENRLTELGCWVIEMFVVTEIFSKNEFAYKEYVALMMRDELIRQEEAEQKARSGSTDNAKKSKKKQGKQKKDDHKGKDEGPFIIVVQDKVEEEDTIAERKSEFLPEPEIILEKSEAVEDLSNVSDYIDCVPEILTRDSGHRNLSRVNWVTYTSEVHPPIGADSSGLSGVQGMERGSPSIVDDSSSTCPDSRPSSDKFVPNIISPSDVLSSLKELPVTTDIPSIPHMPFQPRPLTSPLVPAVRPAVTVSSLVQTLPVLNPLTSTQLFSPLVSQPEIRPGPTFFQSSPSREEYPFMDMIHDLLDDEPGPQIRRYTFQGNTIMFGRIAFQIDRA